MTDSKHSAWGESETQFFFELTPERILSAVEALGFRCTGHLLQLNSMENRVYQVEIELPVDHKVTSPRERYRIVKFYRPGRWSREQILEEHIFLADLAEREIPVVSPLKDAAGETLFTVPGLSIWYVVWPMVGGRSPDELDSEKLAQAGRLLGRIHRIGAIRPAPHRVRLVPDTYGRENLAFLKQSTLIPEHLRARYFTVADAICTASDPLFQGVPMHRVHGDCHFGNLLWNDQGLFWVDFDDMVTGPAVQDIWLLVPGRDEYAIRQREELIAAYQQMHEFDLRTLRLIEPLRALRFIHFSAWIGKRWHDPAFPRVFPNYGSERYWSEQIADLEEQLQLIV